MTDTGVKRVTKADILGGTDNVYYERFEELGGELPLKPLTDGQWAQVKFLMMQGVKARGKPGQKNPDMEFEVCDLAKNEYEASVLAVSYSICNGESWTTEDVKKLSPPGIVKRIAEKVYEISGVEPGMAKEIENFRGQ